MTPPDTSGRKSDEANPEGELMDAPLVQIRGLSKTYPTLDAVITAADNVDLDITTGSTTALVGASGSGKSTLLHLIGALDRPDTGTITVEGTDITRLRGKKAAAYRRTVGFVFQRFNLLPTLTVLDNITIPLIPTGLTAEGRDRAHQLITAIGLEGRENTLATRLSGGQQQRVAIARGLITRPRLVLADEPTGNLDTDTGTEIIDLLLALPATYRTTLIIATHDTVLAARCDRTVHIHDGRVQRPGRHVTAT